MRAHLLQVDIAWEDKRQSRARAERLLDAAEPVDAGDLIVLPEMCETGFSMRTDLTADRDGSGAAWLAGIARERRCFVIGGITVAPPSGLALNRACIFGPDGAAIDQYDKVHPFSFGKESGHFAGGVRAAVVAVGGLRLAPAVCYDLRFPELFRAGRALGAEAFAVIANWPAERAHHWRSLLIARAIENQAIVLGVNRAGADPHLRYAGGSIAVGPRGEVIAEAGEAETVLQVALDPAAARQWRAQFRAWDDARPGLLPRTDAMGRFPAG